MTTENTVMPLQRNLRRQEESTFDPHNTEGKVRHIFDVLRHREFESIKKVAEEILLREMDLNNSKTCCKGIQEQTVLRAPPGNPSSTQVEMYMWEINKHCKQYSSSYKGTHQPFVEKRMS